MPFVRISNVGAESPRGIWAMPPWSRVLIMGPPNSFKTTALLTWYERPEEPLHILSFPGEKGHATIPRDVPGIHAYVWEFLDENRESPEVVVREVERTTKEILAGKHGPVGTLAGDGLHKLYAWYYRKHFQALGVANPTADEDKMSGRAYGKAHEDFGLYLTQTLQTPTPQIVMTCWEGRSKDDPEDTSRRPSTHIFPDLPGQMATRLVGEFPVTVYAEVSRSGDHEGKRRAVWQLRPEGKVWGVGAKLPPELGKALPRDIPQDFRILRAAMQGMPDADLKALWRTLKAEPPQYMKREDTHE